MNVLVIAPHLDDEVLGVGGTIVKHVESGDKVIVAIVAASAAVTISGIPFEGPIGAVRMGYVDGEFIVNPQYEQIEGSTLEIIVAGTEEGITMVEGGAKEISEEIMLKAIEEAHKKIKELCRLQRELATLVGKEQIALPLPEEKIPSTLREEIYSWAEGKMQKACFQKGKMERMKAMSTVRQEALEVFSEKLTEEGIKAVSGIFEELESDIVRKSIIEKKVRSDGRKPEDIRSISCEVDVLPRTHGSGLFTRGETQALAVTTLGTVYDEQIMDTIEGDSRKGFMLHYNFPPFSVGETKRLMVGRREIGHGHLAERAIKAMLHGVPIPWGTTTGFYPSHNLPR